MFAKISRWIQRQSLGVQVPLWLLYGVAWAVAQSVQFLARFIGQSIGGVVSGTWLAKFLKVAAVLLLLGAVAVQVGAYQLANLLFTLAALPIMGVGAVVAMRGIFSPSKKKKRT